MSRLELLMQLNPEFAEALARGERWAIMRADAVEGLDGRASRAHPERAFREDGQRRNWCGQCPSKQGCVQCDLPAKNRTIPKGLIGKWED